MLQKAIPAFPWRILMKNAKDNTINLHDRLDCWLLEELKEKTGRTGRDEEELTLCLYDSDGTVMGGLEGRFLFESFYLDLLAVDPCARHQKAGSRLMEQLEAECLRRKIYTIFLNTQDYQAPGFYRKLGYEICGKMEDTPFRGTSRIFLKKVLKPEEGRKKLNEEPD